MKDVFINRRFDDAYRRHPLTLADVGARGGLRPNWQAARRHLRLIGFEPDEREYLQLVERARVEQSSDRFFNVALHNHRGSVDLYVARDRGLTSIFEPNRPFLDEFPDASRFDTTDRVPMAVDTLDAVVEAAGLDDVDFIKADTQGSERFVLEGASRALARSVIGVEVEVEFAPIYKNQPLFADVDALLRPMGYELFDLRPCYWKRADGRGLGGPYGQIIWADALYLKSLPALRQMVEPLDASRRSSKMLRALSVALLYGYVDYALQIVHDTSVVWTSEERAVLESSLREIGRPAPTRAPLPGRPQATAVLRRLLRWSQARTDAWSVSDAGLGNPE